jgi:hypothetical protein
MSLKMEFDDGITLPPGLADAMCSYFDNENDANWQRTYEARTRAFRQRVPYDVYARTMSAAQRNIGVGLIRWRALEVHDLDMFVLSGDFFEIENGSSQQLSSTPLRSLGEEVLWINDEGWKCIACGYRTRYALNIGFF